MSLRLQLSEDLGLAGAYFPGLRLTPCPGYRPTYGGEPVAPVSVARPGVTGVRRTKNRELRHPNYRDITRAVHPGERLKKANHKPVVPNRVLQD